MASDHDHCPAATCNTWPPIARRVAANYLVVQAMAGGAWWVMLWAWPASRGWFFPAGRGDAAVLALALPDIGLFVLGSLAAAAALRRRATLGLVATAVVAGATAYATLLCWGASLVTGEAWLATLLMTAAVFMSGVCVWFAWPGVSLDWLFRASTSPPGRRHVLHTLAQTAGFWLTFLLLIPAGLAAPEVHAGIPGWQTGNATRLLAAVLFVAGGTLGITSGITMARAGRGTPLPTACPSELVVAGPYRFVRNPMAVAGLTQGAAIALWLGSPLVLAYVLAGAIVWHAIVRPLEEHDLAQRFGEAYEGYRWAVRCWLPMSLISTTGRATILPGDTDPTA